MTKEEWERLNVLCSKTRHKITCVENRELQILLDKTMLVDEHPEDWDGPCLCQLCCSYMDQTRKNLCALSVLCASALSPWRCLSGERRKL
jgi:hypothetical protein